MEQIEEIEMQLWEYIDGACTEADTQRISGLIANGGMWQEKFDELTTLHSTLSGSMELEQPSLRFNKNIMEAVGHTHIAPATKKYINPYIIRGIAAFFILAIATLFIYALATANWATTGGTDTLSKFYPSKININTLFDSNFFNVVIVLNIILGLLLVDGLVRRKRMESIR